jgi:hypothetical protein
VIGQPGLDVLDLQRLVQVRQKLEAFVAVEREPLERLGLFDDDLAISASMRGKSSSLIGCGRSKS